MNVKDLNTLYIAQLKDVYSAETQLVSALPKMIEHAQSDTLRKGLENHLEETREQADRLRAIFDSLDYSPGGEKCAAMEGLIREANELVGEHVDNTDAVDAAIVCACQKVEHYEIATYGTLCHYAETLGRSDDASLLKRTLDEEKQADKTLTEVAVEVANPAATKA